MIAIYTHSKKFSNAKLFAIYKYQDNCIEETLDKEFASGVWRWDEQYAEKKMKRFC